MRKKRPRDFNQAAKLVVDIASGEAQDAIGKVPNRAKGGQKGGKARARALTAEQRSKMATARWKKS